MIVKEEKPGIAADRLAEAVGSAYGAFMVALGDRRRRWPEDDFRRLFDAIAVYIKTTARDKTIHRDVAAYVSGLRSDLELQGNRVPGNALFDADRLETMLFAGYDPSFDGLEPPGL